MDDSVNDETIEPVSASADGKRNAHSFVCLPTEQSMNYAACLWRQNVLTDASIKTPADWAGCITARRNGTCTALHMRQEEELAGRAIYFKDRNMLRKITDAARKWIGPAVSSVISIGKSVAPKSAPRSSGSMLDAMGSAGSFADAVTEAAKTPAGAPPVSMVARAPLPVALAGESPLQMARRVAAERAANGTL